MSANPPSSDQGGPDSGDDQDSAVLLPKAGLANVGGVLGLTICLEVGLWVVMFSPEASAIFAPVPPVATGFIGHVLIVLSLCVWSFKKFRHLEDMRFPGLLTITTTFLGVLGPLFTLVTVLLYLVFRTVATNFHEWYVSLFPEHHYGEAEMLYEQISTGRDQSTASAQDSFIDIMGLGTPGQKQAVVALVSRNFRPVFTPALKLALADKDPSVRVQAATAVARVENQFHEKWLTLESRTQRHPKDSVAWHALARHLDDYAFAGLLDVAREAEIRTRALTAYRACYELHPENSGARCDLGRLLLRLGNVLETAQILEPLIPTSRDARVLSWYTECLYRLRRFEELRVLAADIPARIGGALPEGLSDLVKLWGGEPVPAGAEADKVQEAAV